MPPSNAPEFRTCPVSSRIVALAPARADRPAEFVRPGRNRHPERTGDACPFCPGRETETPPELFALHDARGWRLRVVPNKFPAVAPESPAFGFHEVLIECPDHVALPTELNDDDFANIFRAYRARLQYHGADSRVESVSLFKNVGIEAGASLSHVHSQLIALPFVPEFLRAELAAAPCEFCRMAGEASRIVVESAHFVVACPFAPRFAFEMWVMPKAHESRFERDEHPAELAAVLRRVLFALDRARNAPDFNWFLHTSPRGTYPGFHWHLEIVPRTSKVAGFEWSGGVFINDVPPERAAADLRDKLPA